MKNLLLLSAIGFLSAGCINMNASRVLPDGTHVTFSANSLFATTAIKNLGVENTTKTTSSLVKMTGLASEPNAESITATADGLGNLIGTAIRTGAGVPK